MPIGLCSGAGVESCVCLCGWWMRRSKFRVIFRISPLALADDFIQLTALATPPRSAASSAPFSTADMSYKQRKDPDGLTYLVWDSKAEERARLVPCKARTGAPLLCLAMRINNHWIRAGASGQTERPLISRAFCQRAGLTRYVPFNPPVQGFSGGIYRHTVTVDVVVPTGHPQPRDYVPADALQPPIPAPESTETRRVTFFVHDHMTGANPVMLPQTFATHDYRWISSGSLRI